MVVMSGYDCTDVRDLTRAEIEGRRQALLAIEALRRYARLRERAPAHVRVHAGDARLAQDHRSLRADRRGRARRGAVRRLDRHLPRVPGRLRRAGHPDHRPLLPGALRHPRAAGGRRPARRRPLRGRRQDLARGDAQPDVLRGDGTGRRSGRGGLAQGWPHHRKRWTSPGCRRSCDARARGWTEAPARPRRPARSTAARPLRER